MQCPVCKSEISDKNIYCSKCGTKIPRCPSCGQAILKRMRFCTNDGTPLPEEIFSALPLEGTQPKAARADVNLSFVMPAEFNYTDNTPKPGSNPDKYWSFQPQQDSPLPGKDAAAASSDIKVQEGSDACTPADADILPNPETSDNENAPAFLSSAPEPQEAFPSDEEPASDSADSDEELFQEIKASLLHNQAALFEEEENTADDTENVQDIASGQHFNSREYGKTEELAGQPEAASGYSYENSGQYGSANYDSRQQNASQNYYNQPPYDGTQDYSGQPAYDSGLYNNSGYGFDGIQNNGSGYGYNNNQYSSQEYASGSIQDSSPEFAYGDNQDGSPEFAYGDNQYTDQEYAYGSNQYDGQKYAYGDNQYGSQEYGYDDRPNEPEKSKKGLLAIIIVLAAVILVLAGIFAYLFISGRIPFGNGSDAAISETDEYSSAISTEEETEEETLSQESETEESYAQEETTGDSGSDALAEYSAVEEFILTCDSVIYTADDFEGWDADMCRKARNGIYARHGRLFDDEELQEYFDSFSWYEGTISPDDFDSSVLTSTELKNLYTLIDYETEMGYR